MGALMDKEKAEILWNDTLVNHATAIIRRKLAEGGQKGRHGWYDDKVISLNSLHNKLKNAIDEGDFEKALVYSAMLCYRIETMPDL